MVRLNTSKLVESGVQTTSHGELVKIFGVLHLSTTFEFESRGELWSTTGRTEHLRAPALGSRTGIPRRRFDLLWSLLTFSGGAPDVPPADGLGHEQQRWARVNDFVGSINAHRSSRVTPGGTICVDEFISRWYGQRGHWKSRELPMYVAIDRKPKSGCEIKDAACGRSGLTLLLRIVATAGDKQANLTAEDLAGSHGTAALIWLV